jgi:hypothetical protein
MKRKTRLLALLPLAYAASVSPAAAEEPPPSWPRVDLGVTRVTGLPRLEMQSPGAWTEVPCVLPCTLRLDPGPAYRVSGDGVVDSDPFRLPAGAGHVRVEVTPGPTNLRGVGLYLTVGGVLFAAGGGALLLLPAGNASTEDKTTKTVVGVGALTMGVVTAAIGMILRALSETSVTVEDVDGSREVSR